MTLPKLLSYFTGWGLLVLFLFGILGAFLFPYSINSWLIYAGKPAKVLWWHGFILGVIPGVGQLIIPIAVITWVAMLFLT